MRLGHDVAGSRGRDEPFAGSTGGVSVREAAARLGVAPSTIKNWIARGCPTCSLGSVGRGHGSTVDPERLRQWRAARALKAAAPTSVSGPSFDPGTVAAALWKLYVRPTREDRTLPSWKLYRLAPAETAALLVDVFQALHREATGRFAAELPAEMVKLLTIYLSSLHRRLTEELPDA
jgi:hypothetical protein